MVPVVPVVSASPAKVSVAGHRGHVDPCDELCCVLDIEMYSTAVNDISALLSVAATCQCACRYIVHHCLYDVMSPSIVTNLSSEQWPGSRQAPSYISLD